MATPAQRLMQRLVKTGLVSAQEARACWRSVPCDKRTPEGIIEALVDRQMLTKYQAKQILGGREKSLKLGNCVVLDELGQGGMGKVYLARHQALSKLVALKTVPPDRLGSDEIIDRFRREVRALAQLEHPHIVSAYDAHLGEGQFYLVMQYVDGEDLAAVVRTHGPLSPEQAVDYVCQAASGLDFAHQQGIIHRDVKPSNLLLDRKGVVKVSDLGLARINAPCGAVGADATRGVTVTGEFRGTVDFVSPEQAEDLRSADARSDIYSLGCTLYWLLTGKPPYQGKTVVATLMAHRLADVPSLRAARADVSEALDHVYQRMVAKDSIDRPQSMSQVIDELRAASRCENRVGAPALPVTSSDEQLSAFLQGIDAEPQRHATHTTQADQQVDTAGEVAKRELRRRSHAHGGKTRRPWFWYLGAGLAIAGLFVLLVMWARPRDTTVRTSGQSGAGKPRVQSYLTEWKNLVPRTGIVRSVSLSGDGRYLAAAEEGALRVWDLEKYIGGPPSTGHVGSILDVEFAPDGETIATAGEDGTLRVWRRQTGKLLSEISTEEGPYRCLAFAANGRSIAAGNESGSVHIWEVGSTAISDSLQAHAGPVTSVAFSTDNTLLASGGADAVIRLWNATTLEEVAQLPGHTQTITAIAFLSPAPLLASAAGEGIGEIGLWDLRTHQLVGDLFRTGEPIWTLCALPGRSQLAYGAGSGGWGRIALRDIRNGDSVTETQLMGSNDAGVVRLTCSRDGRRLAACLEGGLIRTWDLDTRQELAAYLGNCEITWALAFSPSGQLLATAGTNSSIKVWDAQSGRELSTWRAAHDNTVRVVKFSPSGESLLSAGMDGKLLLWDVATARVMRAFQADPTEPVFAAAFAPDGRRIVTGGGEPDRPQLRVWSAESGHLDRELEGHRQPISCVAISPHGILASGGHDGAVMLWSDGLDAAPRTFRDHTNWISAVAFSPDGSLLASSSYDRSVIVRDLKSGQTRRLVGHDGPVVAIAFSHDGAVLLSAGEDKTMRVWDVRIGTQIEQRETHGEPWHCLALSADGRLVASASRQGANRLWRLETSNGVQKRLQQ